MYFCCSTKGNPSIPIELPVHRSFYLIAYNSTDCQKVKGFDGVSEFIQWDDEDRGNANAHSKLSPYGVNTDAWNTRIYYCFYNAGMLLFQFVPFFSSKCDFEWRITM